MATGIILARALLPASRGQLAAALLWSTLLSAIGTLGVAEAVTYKLAKAGRSVPELLGSALTLATAQSLLFMGIGASILPFALANATEPTLVSAYLFLLDVPITIIGLTVMGILNGRGHFRWFHLIRFLIVAMTLPPLLALALGDLLTVRTAVVVYLVVRLGVILLAAGALMVLERPRFKYDSQTARELLSYGVKSHASGISAHMNQRADQLLISIFLAPAKLGIYTIAGTLNSIGWVIGGSVAYAALPAVSALEPGPARTELARRFVALTLLVGLFCALPLIVMAPTLIDLFFGKAYHEAGNVARVLLLSVVVFSVNRSVESILRAVNRPLEAGLAEIVALCVTIASLSVLLPLAGLIGAAFASVVGASVASIWMSRRAARALETTITGVLLPTKSDARAALEWVSKIRAR